MLLHHPKGHDLQIIYQVGLVLAGLIGLPLAIWRSWTPRFTVCGGAVGVSWGELVGFLARKAASGSVFGLFGLQVWPSDQMGPRIRWGWLAPARSAASC